MSTVVIVVQDLTVKMVSAAVRQEIGRPQNVVILNLVVKAIWIVSYKNLETPHQ